MWTIYHTGNLCCSQLLFHHINSSHRSCLITPSSNLFVQLHHVKPPTENALKLVFLSKSIDTVFVQNQLAGLANGIWVPLMTICLKAELLYNLSTLSFDFIQDMRSGKLRLWNLNTGRLRQQKCGRWKMSAILWDGGLNWLLNDLPENFVCKLPVMAGDKLNSAELLSIMVVIFLLVSVRSYVKNCLSNDLC